MLQDLSRQKLAITIGQHSVAGRKPLNQDFHGTLVPVGRVLTLKGAAFALADGISSSPVAHVAAETAVKSFLDDYYCTSDTWTVKIAASRVIAAANSWLNAQNSGTSDRNRGYLTTFSALVLKSRQAHVFHVGDSRVWRLAGGSLEQLTNDHRVELSAEESYLARALGLSASVEIDYRRVEIEAGDVFVLTTDGVHDHVPPRALAACVAEAADLDKAARDIVALALSNGSADNLTIQIVRIDALPPADADTALGEADTLQPAALPQPPCDFEGYRILRSLHASSRSHLFLATDLESGDRVALKVPSIGMRDNADHLRRFAMEEWIARRINSPHVVSPAAAHRQRKSRYIVTEYIEGQTLRQWMADNPAPSLETVRGIVEQVARGLRAFHRKEMLHQDLRPENVMIDREGTVKIIDLGSVRVAGVLEALPDLDAGEMLGTVQYSAPEYILGKDGSERSDLFSLGVIAYEMLTGRLPYGDRMARARTPRAQAKVSYVPASSLDPRVPVWVDGALRKAVHPSPLRRQEALSEFLADMRTPNPAIGPGRSIPLVERDPVAFWKVVSVLLALVVLILAFLLLEPS
jgi:serine/threonine protein phosphatase PrpC